MGAEINIKEIEKAFLSAGVQIKDSDGNCKSFYSIMGEMSKAWDGLNLTQYVKLYGASVNMHIREFWGKEYPEEYEWGKPEFWINEVFDMLSKRKVDIESFMDNFGGISKVRIGNASEPYTMIEFSNGIEIYAENQSPPWAAEENDKILNALIAGEEAKGLTFHKFIREGQPCFHRGLLTSFIPSMRRVWQGWR